MKGGGNLTAVGIQVVLFKIQTHPYRGPMPLIIFTMRLLQVYMLLLLDSRAEGPVIGEIFGCNRLHVDILRFLHYKIGVYSINYSKMIGNYPAVLNFNRLFLKLNWFICN